MVAGAVGHKTAVVVVAGPIDLVVDMMMVVRMVAVADHTDRAVEIAEMVIGEAVQVMEGVCILAGLEDRVKELHSHPGRKVVSRATWAVVESQGGGV